MPLVISRETGAVSAPEYSQEQIDKAWEQIVKAWAEANKSTLQALAEEYAPGPCGG